MLEENSFGEFLRYLLNATEEKSYILSEHLGYDITYISKWLNGSRLPSERVIQKINADIASFFADRLAANPDRQLVASIIGRSHDERMSSGEMQKELAYHLGKLLQVKYESSLSSFKGGDAGEKGADGIYIQKKSKIIKLMKSAILKQAGAKKIEIYATVDLYSLFEDLVTSLFDQSALFDISVHLSQIIDTERFKKHSESYFDNIIKTINVSNAPNLTFYRSLNGQNEHVIVIKDVIAFTLVMNGQEIVSCCYTYEDCVITSLCELCVATFKRLPRFLSPLESEMLIKSNTQIDFYMQSWARVFLYGAPVLFLDPRTIDEIAAALPMDVDENRTYAVYIKMLSHAWEHRMRFGDFRGILFKSCLLEYLRSGVIDLGYRRISLTPSQRMDHANHLGKVLRENPNIRISLIDDTASAIHQFRYGVSMFVGAREVILEKSYNPSNSLPFYHKLNHSEDIDLFCQYFEQTVANKYVMAIGGEELTEYMKLNIALAEKFYQN